MAYGYSAMVFDQRVFVTYNPFNLYVTQVCNPGDSLLMPLAPVLHVVTSHANPMRTPANASPGCTCVVPRSSTPNLQQPASTPHPLAPPNCQPEVKPGCVLRRSNFSVLEREKLVSDKQARLMCQG